VTNVTAKAEGRRGAVKRVTLKIITYIDTTTL
jgi:hypothetical protein